MYYRYIVGDILKKFNELVIQIFLSIPSIAMISDVMLNFEPRCCIIGIGSRQWRHILHKIVSKKIIERERVGHCGQSYDESCDNIIPT